MEVAADLSVTTESTSAGRLSPEVVFILRSVLGVEVEESASADGEVDCFSFLYQGTFDMSDFYLCINLRRFVDILRILCYTIRRSILDTAVGDYCPPHTILSASIFYSHKIAFSISLLISSLSASSSGSALRFPDFFGFRVDILWRFVIYYRWKLSRIYP